MFKPAHFSGLNEFHSNVEGMMGSGGNGGEVKERPGKCLSGFLRSEFCELHSFLMILCEILGEVTEMLAMEKQQCSPGRAH